jgi:hypothetical protein
MGGGGGFEHVRLQITKRECTTHAVQPFVRHVEQPPLGLPEESGEPALGAVAELDEVPLGLPRAVEVAQVIPLHEEALLVLVVGGWAGVGVGGRGGVAVGPPWRRRRRGRQRGAVLLDPARAVGDFGGVHPGAHDPPLRQRHGPAPDDLADLHLLLFLFLLLFLLFLLLFLLFLLVVVVVVVVVVGRRSVLLPRRFTVPGDALGHPPLGVALGRRLRGCPPPPPSPPRGGGVTVPVHRQTGLKGGAPLTRPPA